MDKIYQLYGQSMFPTIRSGDKVVLEKVAVDTIRIQDMLIYKKKNVYPCHRLIKIGEQDGKKLFYMKGDFGNKLDIVREEMVLGRAKAIIHKGKIKNTAFFNSRIYVLFVNFICFLKTILQDILSMLYNYKLVYRLRNIILPVDVSYEFIKDIYRHEDFKSFYRLTLSHDCSSEVCFGFLARVRGRPAAKIWVLKNGNGEVLIYGPYVRVLYRRRNIGRQMLERALVQIKKEFNVQSVYSIINFHLLPEKCQQHSCLPEYMTKIPSLNLMRSFGFIFDRYERAALFMKCELKSMPQKIS